MGAADGKDLPDVMASVREVEASPLRCAERAENEVALAGNGAEGFFGLGEDVIEAEKRFYHFVGELLA